MSNSINHQFRSSVHVSTVRRVLAVAVASGLIAGTGLAYADRAEASPDQDAVFLAALSAAGYTYADGSVGVVIGNAHTVCRMLAGGVPKPDVTTALDNVETGVDRWGAELFAALAIEVYCPQFDDGQVAA